MVEWMGRYRPVVAAIVQHVNIVSKKGVLHHIYEDIYLSPNEWQVLEYIVEHKDEDKYMNNIVEALAIPQSSFSRIQKKLCELGLLDQFQRSDNRKNVILKPTEYALQAYNYHSQEIYETIFKRFFEDLSGFSDEQLLTFSRAIKHMSSGAEEEEGKQITLIKRAKKEK